MARPREFNEDQVTEALMEVFWEKGYQAASMQDLVAATGLLKGSLYGAFGDKQALYLVALRHYDRTRIQAGIDMLNSGQGSVEQKVSRLFDSVIESVETGVFAGGCLLCNASVEMAAIDSSVGSEVNSTIRRLQAALVATLTSSGISADEAEASAAFIISTYFGSRVLAKAGAPLRMIADARDRCLEILRSR
jgi:TetR/AcrR family transcriptional repressor of nem operon